MSTKNLPATIAIRPIQWPKEITADVDEMRPGAMNAWRELVKVAERKAPMTDLTRLHQGMVGAYTKRQGSEIHEKAILYNIASRSRDEPT